MDHSMDSQSTSSTWPEICQALSYETFLKIIDINLFKNTTNKEFLNKECCSVLIPYRSFPGKFRIPVYEEIISKMYSNEVNTSKAGRYYPELCDKYYLFEDFIVHSNYKYDLTSVKRTLNEKLQVNKEHSNASSEELSCLMDYLFYLQYEDMDKNVHLVLVALLENAENVHLTVKRDYSDSYSIYQQMKLLKQCEVAIRLHFEKLRLYQIPDKTQSNGIQNYPLFPSYPAFSMRGVWYYPKNYFKISLFTPYFEDAKLHTSGLFENKLQSNHFLEQINNDNDILTVFSYQLRSLGLASSWIFLKNDKFDSSEDIVAPGIDNPQEITVQNCDQQYSSVTNLADLKTQDHQNFGSKIFKLVTTTQHSLEKGTNYVVKNFESTYIYPHSIAAMLNHKKINLKKVMKHVIIEKLAHSKNKIPTNQDHDIDIFHYFEILRECIRGLKNEVGSDEYFSYPNSVSIEQEMVNDIVTKAGSSQSQSQSGAEQRQIAQLQNELQSKLMYEAVFPLIGDIGRGHYMQQCPQKNRILKIRVEYLASKNFIDVQAFSPPLCMSIEFGDEINSTMSQINNRLSYLGGEVDPKRVMVFKSALLTTSYEDIMKSLLQTIDICIIPVLVLIKHLNYVLESEIFGWMSRNAALVTEEIETYIASYKEYFENIYENGDDSSPLTEGEAKILQIFEQNHEQWDNTYKKKVEHSMSSSSSTNTSSGRNTTQGSSNRNQSNLDASVSGPQSAQGQNNQN